MEEKKEIIDMLIQRETFYRCNEDGSFSKVDLVNEFYEDICKELDRAERRGLEKALGFIIGEGNTSWAKDKIVESIKLLEEENGKQNAR